MINRLQFQSFTWLKQALIICCLSVFLTPVAMAEKTEKVGKAETQLLKGFKSIHDYSFNQAMRHIETLATENPKYQLAQLMKADFLAIKAGKSEWIKRYRLANPKKVNALLQEAQVRWEATSLTPSAEHAILGQFVLKSSVQPYLIIVNSHAHRLFLYEQKAGAYHEVANYYVSIGRKGTGKQIRGDLKTPIGVYQVVKHLSDRQLPELYGVAALTLNYPNQWDRQLGRTGSGIWLHGTPRSTYSRPPMASKGCVVLNNPAMTDLIRRYQLPLETPVIITPDANMHPLNMRAELAVADDKQQVLSRINTWLREQQDYQVDWSKVGVFHYPGEKGMYYVSFPTLVGGRLQMVEQFWKKANDQNGWRLVLKAQQTTPSQKSDHSYDLASR